MSPGKRKQRARKRRAKGRTRADRRARSDIRYVPVKPPAPGTLIPRPWPDPRQGPYPTTVPDEKPRAALALGGGHVHTGEIPAFAIAGYELLTAHPFLVAALVGGDVKPSSLIVEVLGHAVLEPEPLPAIADGGRQAIEARFDANGLMFARYRTHVWVVLFDDNNPAVTAPIGVVIADESLQHGFGPSSGQFPLPFQPIMIEPGYTASATARPQVANFKPTRLFIAGGPDVIADFVVDNITIKNRSQFSQSGYIPADMFSTSTAIDAFVSFEAAGVGEDITVTVRNVGHQARQLAMTMLGTVRNRIRIAVTTHADVEAALASIISAPLRADLAAQVGG